MNWYKTSQQNNKMVTIEQIVQAIDKEIIEKGLLSSEDFRNARMEGASPVAKAAQVKEAAKPKSFRHPITPKLEKEVLDLVRRGIFSVPKIVRNLSDPTVHPSVVKEILDKNNVKKTEDRNDFYDKSFSESVNQIVDESRQSYHEGPTIQEVATILGTSTSVVSYVIKKNGLNWLQLRTDRRRRIASMVNTVILEAQESGDTVNSFTIVERFKAKTGYVLEAGALRRALDEIGRTSSGEKVEQPLVPFFKSYLYRTRYKGLYRLFEKYSNNPKMIIPELNRLIDMFFELEGPALFDEDYGHLNVSQKNDADKAKEIIHAKLRIQDFIMGQLPEYQSQNAYPALNAELGQTPEMQQSPQQPPQEVQQF